MTRVLAIHEDTNAGAAVLHGGEIVAAVAEERLTRRKYQPGFPAQAIDEVLGIAGALPGEASVADAPGCDVDFLGPGSLALRARGHPVDPPPTPRPWLRPPPTARLRGDLDLIDTIVAGNRYHFLARLPWGEAAIEGEHDFFGARHKAYLALQARFARGGALARFAEAYDARALKRRFGREVPLIDHHTAHAYSAYCTSGYDEALAVSIDNMGDGFSARVFRCRSGRCEPLWSSDAVASAGQFYGEISQLLGFHVLMAGKVTGLAARGDPRPAYPVMERLFGLTADRTDFTLSPPLWRRSRGRGPFGELSRFSKEDIAAAAQRRLEDVVVRYVRHAVQHTDATRLVLAGGVFANVLLNRRLWALPGIEGLFVHPAMSDQGVAVGAALAWQAEQGTLDAVPMDHAYYGPEFSETEIGDALEAAGLRYRRVEDIDAAVARRILRKQTVARFTGRMEYGPRALGHRSILFHTADPSVNDWLNERLERSEFMPFAPATLAEHAAECYEGYGPGVRRTARFMNLAFDCSRAMRKYSPAVVHLDGTARPQVVHADASPGLHRILRLVHGETGVPSVLNTSFNLHGEPIVHTPAQAIRSFLRARLDALAIGPFLAEAAD